MNHQQFPDRSDKTGAPEMSETTPKGPSKKVSLPTHIAGKVAGVALGILSAAGIAGCERNEKPAPTPTLAETQYVNTPNARESMHVMHPDILAMTQGTDWELLDFAMPTPSNTSFEPAAVPIYIAKSLMEKPEIYGFKKSQGLYWEAIKKPGLIIKNKEEDTSIHIDPTTKEIVRIFSHHEIPEGINAQFRGKEVTRAVLDQIRTSIKAYINKKEKDAQLREENKKKFEPLARENDFARYDDGAWFKFIDTDEVGEKDWFYLKEDLHSMIYQNIALSSDGGRIEKINLKIDQYTAKAKREEADRNEAEMAKKYGGNWEYDKTTGDIPEDEWKKALELKKVHYFSDEIIEVPGFEGQEITPELIKKIHAATIKAAKEYIAKKRLELRGQKHLKRSGSFEL